MVALVAVENQQPARSLRTRYYIVVEVLNLIQAPLVVGLSIIGRIDRPVAWNTSLIVPAGLVVFYGEYNKWR